MKKMGLLAPVAMGLAGLAIGTGASAAPMTYEVDSAHTYPSFEADHMGGLSKWRGKINSTTGSIVLDKEAQTGSVDVTMDMSTIDFGHDGLNDHTKGDDPGMFNVSEHPTATYEGDLVDWQNGAPTAVDGTLTLHGTSQPVRLDIESFKCQPARGGGEVCGATAMAEIDRADFGVNFGESFGFDMGVVLRISIEANEAN